MREYTPVLLPGGYTVYWCDCLGTPYSDMCFSFALNLLSYTPTGGEGWLGFPDLWSGKKKPWWNWYLTPVENFGEVRMTQLIKSTLLTSTLVPLGIFFRSLKVSSDAKERVGCGKQWETTTPIQSLVKLQRWFLSLRGKTCLRKNCNLGSCACSEAPALGQNTLMMIFLQW